MLILGNTEGFANEKHARIQRMAVHSYYNRPKIVDWLRETNVRLIYVSGRCYNERHKKVKAKIHEERLKAVCLKKSTSMYYRLSYSMSR